MMERKRESVCVCLSALIKNDTQGKRDSVFQYILRRNDPKKTQDTKKKRKKKISLGNDRIGKIILLRSFQQRLLQQGSQQGFHRDFPLGFPEQVQ